MSPIQIQSEADRPGGWSYLVRIQGGHQATDHEVGLAWVDHDHWSGGRLPPSTVVHELLSVLLDSCGHELLPRRFDASTARRWVPGLDAAMRLRL